MLSRRSVGSVEIVAFTGVLDAAATPAARREIKDVLDSGQVRLVVDLSDVRFIDSSGLSILVTALKAARAAGGDVVLLKPPPVVRTLLELTRLHRVLEIFEDEPAAVARVEA